jgi:TP901 family phage tail tape measure protein
VAEIIKTSIDVDINTSGAAAELRKLQQQINAFNLTLNKSQKIQNQASRAFADSLADAVNRTGTFRAEVVRMQTSANALDSTLRKGQATLGQFFSAAFNKRSAIAAETFALASERARTMQTQFIATGKASKGMQDALAIRPLTAFSSELSIASQRTQILGSMFRQGTTQLINFGKNVQWAGRQLMVGFTVPLTIFGATAGRVFRDLEMQAVAFKKVYGDIFTTPMELESNLKAVEGLSKEFTKYGIAAKDTMSLAAQAAAAGRRNGELTDAVRESTRLATLGQMDQNSALETTIALQSAFRLSGQELADTINFLNMVENQTVVSLQDIASAIPRVAPVIKGLGGDVKDLTVFLAAMQEGGVSAEQGSNALKSGLGSLINPSKEATKQLGDLGININAIVQQNQGDLMGIVTTFSKALETLGEFQQQQVLETLFGKYQYARLGALFENIIRDGSQAQQVIATMGYTTEQLASSAEKELKVVEQAFSVQLVSAIEKLKLAIAPIGELFTKMAIPIVNFLTKIVEWFNRLPEGVKNFAALATVITGLLIPAATMMFGLFANLIGTLAKMGQSITMLGVTLLRKGPLAAIKSLTESGKYLSLSEIDAANAARQLGSATSFANEALLRQVGSANNAKLAIDNLTLSYQRLIAQQVAAKNVQSTFFATGAAASELSKNAPASKRILRRNKGGKVFSLNQGNMVPGSGNTDTVPAMLTPGEFVVNKEATKNNVGLLSAINAQRYNKGGGVANVGKMFYGDPGEYTYDMFVRQYGLNFSGGKHQGNIKKTSYKQLKVLFDQYTKYGIDEKGVQELGKLAQSFQNKHNEKRMKSQHVKDMAVKLNLTDDANKNNFFKGMGLSKPNAAHTTAPRIVKVKSWSDFDFSKTGIPVQELSNRVIRLNADTNNMMRGQGVPASQLFAEIQKTGLDIFDYQDAQFSRYLDFVAADNPKGRLAYGKSYEKALPKAYESLLKQLSALGDTMITDDFKSNSTRFESLYDVAMQEFDKVDGGRLTAFTGEIRTFSNQRAPRVQDLVKFFKESAAIKEYATNNGINLQTILDGNEGAKGKKLWRILLEANGHDTSDPLKRQGIWEKILDKNGNIQQSIEGKIGSQNRLAFYGTKVKQILDLRRSGGRMAFANKGGIAKGIAKAMGLNADDALGAFGLRVPTPRTNIKPIFGKNSRMKDVFENPNYKDGIYLVSPDGGVPYEAWLFNNNGRLRMQRMGSYNTGSGLNTRTSQYDWVDVDPDMRANVYTRNEYTGSNVSSPIKAFNKGNIVPGSGNTDTVPAMLTPGEFVVNKQATKNNLGLLHSINSQKLNVGGKVKGMQYFLTGGEVQQVIDYKKNNPGSTTPQAVQALGLKIGGAMPKGMVRGAGAVGAVAGIASQVPAMAMYDTLGPIGGMVASTVAWTAASKLATVAFNKVTGNSKILAEAAKTAGTATGKLGAKALLATKILGLAAGSWLSIGASVATLVYSMNKTGKEISESGKKYVEALYGSSDKMSKFAESFGRENVQQQLASRRAELVTGGPVSEEAKQFSTQFLQGDAGKQMLADLQTVSKTGGTQSRNDAILNQLLRGVVTKSITAEEARAIAMDIGTQLNDQSIGVNIAAKISRLAGPNGEDLADNILQVNALIKPKLDIAATEKIVAEQWSKTNIFQKMSANMFGGGADSIFSKTIATQALQTLEITKEQLDLLKLELESGNITYSEFINKKTMITLDSVNVTKDAMTALSEKFINDTEGMKNAVDEFRNEVKTSFETKLENFSPEDAAKIRGFQDKVSRGGSGTTQVERYGVTQTLPTAQTEKGLAAQTALETLSPELSLALSSLEKADLAAERLSDLFALDPTTLYTIEEYFTLGGDLGNILGKSVFEIQNYQEALDRLSAVPEKFKTDVDIATLIGDPKKLESFTIQATKSQEALDYLSKQKNITKEVAMNVITTYLGDNAIAKQLLEHYLSTGNKFEDLDLNAIITMGVSNPQVASALAIIEKAKSGANVGMSALVQAYDILSKEGESAGAGMQQGGGDGGSGEDPLKAIKDQIADTNTLIGASQKLIAVGLRPEIAATLSAAEAKALLAKKSGDLIKKLNDEADKSKVLANIYKDPRQVAIDSYNKQIEFIDRTISAIDRQISTIRRKNELDQRDIGVRQRALESITKKEKEVNDQYNLRFESLNKVSKINDRITQQTQDRISLSSALVSGDFGAAASAAASMTGNFASAQVEDARVALELQRDQEIASIGALVNGQLMTKEQIEASIDVIQERMYQRDQQILGLQDQIYLKEEEKYLLQQNVQLINDQIAEQTAKQTAKMAEQVGVAESLRKKLFAQYEIAKAIAQRNWGAKFGSYNTGGEVKTFAYGGSVYRGSKEPPPALRMAMGSIVPGMGLSDKVPALLTPGEFVVRKSVAQANMPLLNALNGNVFPGAGSFAMPETTLNSPNNVVSNISSPVYNYSVNVNVPNTTSSPNEIADVVINKIKMTQGREIRRNRF